MHRKPRSITWAKLWPTTKNHELWSNCPGNYVCYVFFLNYPIFGQKVNIGIIGSGELSRHMKSMLGHLISMFWKPNLTVHCQNPIIFMKHFLVEFLWIVAAFVENIWRTVLRKLHRILLLFLFCIKWHKDHRKDSCTCEGSVIFVRLSCIV